MKTPLSNFSKKLVLADHHLHHESKPTFVYKLWNSIQIITSIIISNPMYYAYKRYLFNLDSGRLSSLWEARFFRCITPLSM